ncbi:DUF6778 family protein [Pseudaestuariivita atlantica]|nr:DUF6778 family protein [Pseudaestuariivita atlantica]
MSKWMRAGAVAAFALLTTGAEAQTSLGTAYGMTQQAMVQSRVTAHLPHSQMQVAGLFEDSLDRVLPLWKVSRPVRLDVTVLRFPDTTTNVKRPQTIAFRLQPVDPHTGRLVGASRTVRMKLRAGQQLNLDRRTLVHWIAGRIIDELDTMGARL